MFKFLKGSKTKAGDAKSTRPRGPDPYFEIVSLDQWTIAFRSRSVYPICQTMVLFVSGGPNQTLTNCRIEVFVNSSRLISPDMIEYTGELQHAPPEFAELFQNRGPETAAGETVPAAQPPAAPPAQPPAAPPAPPPVVVTAPPVGPGAENRIAQRASRSFRVVSRDLQRFKAMCGDISSSGIKLVADEEIEKGKQLELDLDFDDFRFPKVRFRAEVVWCKRRDEKTWWVGMRFIEIQDQERRLLETYVEFVSRMQAPLEADTASS